MEERPRRRSSSPPVGRSSPPGAGGAIDHRPVIWRTIVAIPLTLAVFVVTTAVMAVGFWFWDDTAPFWAGAIAGGGAGVIGGRAAADQFVPGYNGKAVFSAFLIAFAAAFALDPEDEIFRDHWLATASVAVLALALAYMVFWRGVTLD